MDEPDTKVKGGRGGAEQNRPKGSRYRMAGCPWWMTDGDRWTNRVGEWSKRVDKRRQVEIQKGKKWRRKGKTSVEVLEQNLLDYRLSGWRQMS